jgi:trehalose synthase
MLQPVFLAEKHLNDYASLVGRELIDEIRERSERLSGKRILHLSATAFGGGVAEILYTLVPLMSDVGLDCQWQVIYGREEFFNATKLMHNALQGNPQDLEEDQWETWLRYNEINARELSGEWDVCIVHDPQPAAIAGLVTERARHWIWRCHIDLSTPNEVTLARLLSHLDPYERAVFHIPEYVPASVDGRSHTMPPAIDPLAPKNMAFSPEDAVYICQQFGIDVDRPLLCQVSRFDPWKDPLGVIDAYRIVKEQMPEVQLALVGSMATDDPEGWDYFNATVAHADSDPDIHILNNLNNVGAIEVNAFQSHCDVAIQKSTREGFGLTVTEAIWKARPFIGGAVGGIPLQVSDGETGFLVSSVEHCAERALQILEDPGLGRQLGRAGKESARRRFLTPRLLRDWLELLEQIGA